MLRRHLQTTLIAGLCAGLAVAASSTEAHAGKRGRAEARSTKATAATKPNKKARKARPSDDAASATNSTNGAETAEKSRDTSEDDRAATAAVVNDNPSASSSAAPAPKAKVYTFSGLDVNGNLKAPQLLFFRGRIKQELDTSNPEKRSFLKELERTADAKGL